MLSEGPTRHGKCSNENWCYDQKQFISTVVVALLRLCSENRFIYRNVLHKFFCKISLESCTIITMQSDNVVREQNRVTISVVLGVI